MNARERGPAGPDEGMAANDLAALLGAPVEIEAVLGEKRVPLGDLSNVEVGADLLLLSRDRSIRLLAAGVEIGEGTAVEVDGHLALRVDRLRPVEEYVAELGGILRALVAERDAVRSSDEIPGADSDAGSAAPLDSD